MQRETDIKNGYQESFRPINMAIYLREFFYSNTTVFNNRYQSDLCTTQAELTFYLIKKLNSSTINSWAPPYNTKSGRNNYFLLFTILMAVAYPPNNPTYEVDEKMQGSC